MKIPFNKPEIIGNEIKYIKDAYKYGQIAGDGFFTKKVNKEFEIKWNDKKSSYVNVYVQVQNLLDAQNVISVYRATGNPEDDGYLTAAASQNAINSQNDPDAFRYLYSLAVNNPSHYSLPRMWRAGISIQF